MIDTTEARLTRQGRQQELLLDMVKRALQRITALEGDVAQALIDIDENRARLEATEDIYGKILAKLTEVCGDLGQIEAAVSGQVLGLAAAGGRDDDAAT